MGSELRRSTTSSSVNGNTASGTAVASASSISTSATTAGTTGTTGTPGTPGAAGSGPTAAQDDKIVPADVLFCKSYGRSLMAPYYDRSLMAPYYDRYMSDSALMGVPKFDFQHFMEMDMEDTLRHFEIQGYVGANCLHCLKGRLHQIYQCCRMLSTTDKDLDVVRRHPSLEGVIPLLGLHQSIMALVLVVCSTYDEMIGGAHE
ncbi:hypothetical protein EDD11_007533 [Mortierella claussenii]|nr:hypothetical protein EDD11_007533 [Mortierella claussenii]